MRKYSVVAFMLSAFFAVGARATLAADTTATPRATSRSHVVKKAPQVPEIPADIKTLGDRLWNAASPAVKSWASQNAAGLARGTGDPDVLARTAVQARWSYVRTRSTSDTLTFLLEYEGLKVMQNDLKDKGEGINETGDVTSQRMQMLMDRRSKAVAALSNAVMKISSAQDDLVPHLK